MIILVAVPGFSFPFLPRHLTMAAFLTIGIPSFVLALAPSDGPLYRGRLIRSLAAFAVPSGVATGIASILSCFLVDTVAGAGLAAGRTAATTTLIFLGLAFVLLLERGPGREGNAVQSYMLSMVAGLGALYALILAAAPVREFFELEILDATEWFLALLSAAVGLTIAALVWRLPVIERWGSGDRRTRRAAAPPWDRSRGRGRLMRWNAHAMRPLRPPPLDREGGRGLGSRPHHALPPSLSSVPPCKLTSPPTLLFDFPVLTPVSWPSLSPIHLSLPNPDPLTSRSLAPPPSHPRTPSPAPTPPPPPKPSLRLVAAAIFRLWAMPERVVVLSVRAWRRP